MTNARKDMVAALHQIVVPSLRANGFTGAFPHFRKMTAHQIDLFSFQFDRYGGGFVVEVAVCSTAGVMHEWGEYIPPHKVTTRDVSERLRLNEKSGQWFRYDLAETTEQVAHHVLDQLRHAQHYWATGGTT